MKKDKDDLYCVCDNQPNDEQVFDARGYICHAPCGRPIRPLAIGRILAVCPGCGRKTEGPREDYDPKNAYTIETECTDCAVGNKPEVIYRDANGDQIFPVAR